jgi:hypothetical protein
MPLPPKGDPRRPLHLAIRSTRLLGGLFVVLGLFSLVPMLISFRGGFMRGMAVYFVVGGMMYFVPGMLYVLCSVDLRRRQVWAVIVGIVLASIQLLFVLFGLLGVTVGLANCLIPLIGVALAQLIYHLSRSFEAIKHPPFGQEAARGFEPLPVAQTIPPPTAAGGGDPNAAPPAR